MRATTGYGAEVVRYDRFSQDPIAMGKQLATDRDLTLIPPYEHPHVMAGQGTAALDLCEDTGPLGALAVPVGGGGLMAGCATVAKTLNHKIRVIGVEPNQADDLKRSLQAGYRISVPVARTIADGLAADIPGEMTFSVNQRLVDDVVPVTDDEIRAAMKRYLNASRLSLSPAVPVRWPPCWPATSCSCQHGSGSFYPVATSTPALH